MSFLVTLAVAALTGCGSSSPAAIPAPSAAPSATATAATSGPAVEPSTDAASETAAPAPSTTVPISPAKPTPSTGPSPPATSASSGKGCPAAGGVIPKGASTRPIVDVDGDGKPDTGWALQPTKRSDPGPEFQFGFSTASGDTSSVGFSPAGGTAPFAFFADVDNAGTIAAIIGNDRGASLYVVSGCKLVPANNPQGQQYAFQLGFGSVGTGIGCSTVAGSSGQTLVGLNDAMDSYGKSNGVTRTQVLINGTKAMNGLSDTVPGTGAALKSGQSITCGNLTLAHDAVTLPMQATN